MTWAPEPKTYRTRDGRLVTRGESKVKWARLSRTGRVHLIEGVIVRWNFHGGTMERPDVTFVALCGPQRHDVIPAPCHDSMDRCLRCDSGPARQGVYFPRALDLENA